MGRGERSCPGRRGLLVRASPSSRVGSPHPRAPRHPAGWELWGAGQVLPQPDWDPREGASKPQTPPVFPAQTWASEQQTLRGFGLICREIFTPSFALFLASPSACQHGTSAGAAAHLLAVAGFFFKHFPPSLFLLHPFSPLCSSSAHPHGHLCFPRAFIAAAARTQPSETREDGGRMEPVPAGICLSRPPARAVTWGEQLVASQTREQTPLLLAGLGLSLLRRGLRQQTRGLLLLRGVRRGIACIRADASLFILTR